MSARRARTQTKESPAKRELRGAVRGTSIPESSKGSVPCNSRRVKKLLLDVNFEQPQRDTCLGEWLARMLHPEFFTAADDIYSAMAAADRALGEESREENVLDKRIEELQAELAALQAARKAG